MGPKPPPYPGLFLNILLFTVQTACWSLLSLACFSSHYIRAACCCCCILCQHQTPTPLPFPPNVIHIRVCCSGIGEICSALHNLIGIGEGNWEIEAVVMLAEMCCSHWQNLIEHLVVGLHDKRWANFTLSLLMPFDQGIFSNQPTIQHHGLNSVISMVCACKWVSLSALKIPIVRYFND